LRRSHPIRVRQDALDHAGTDLCSESVACHAQTDRVAPTKDAEIRRAQSRERAGHTFLDQGIPPDGSDGTKKARRLTRTGEDA